MNHVNQSSRTNVSFDSLPEVAKFELAAAILQRIKDSDLPSLTDDELVNNAKALFLELDQRELNDERSAA